MESSPPLSSPSSHQAGVSPGKGVALLRCAGVLWFIPSFLFSCFRVPPTSVLHDSPDFPFPPFTLVSLPLPTSMSIWRLSPLSCLSSFRKWITGNDDRLHWTESERMFWRTLCSVCLVCITVTKREKQPDLVLALLSCLRPNVGWDKQFIYGDCVSIQPSITKNTHNRK